MTLVEHLHEKSWNTIFPHWGHEIRSNQRWSDFLKPRPHDDDEIKFAQRIEAAPKIELHVHLEAAVPAGFYSMLNASRQLFEERDEPAARSPFADFRSFITAWLDNARLIDDHEIFFALGRAFVHDRAAQNIVYSEVHTSSVDFSIMRARYPALGKQLDFRSCLAALCRGIGHGLTERPDIEVRIIADLLWISTPAEKATMIEGIGSLIAGGDARSPRGDCMIVAVGLGGPECSSREEVDAQLESLNLCRDLGLGVDIHCGETSPAELADYAATKLRPNRIAHGISGSPASFFGGHISACPLSNIQTGVFAKQLPDHPIAIMHGRDLSFSVNSDDPLLFGTTLTLEYVALRKAFGWGLDFFKKTQENARSAAFRKSAQNIAET
jgi:adenosine deaminase